MFGDVCVNGLCVAVYVLFVRFLLMSMFMVPFRLCVCLLFIGCLCVCICVCLRVIDVLSMLLLMLLSFGCVAVSDLCQWRRLCVC